MKHKSLKIFLGILAVSLVASVILVTIKTFFLSGKLGDTDITKTEEEMRAEELLEKNQDAIELAKKAKNFDIRKIEQDDHVKGDLDSPVQMVVYSNFECPFCPLYNDIIKKVEEEFAENIVIAFRHFPLRAYPKSLPAALASECAGEQNKFWEMYDLLYRNSEENRLNEEQYVKDAESLELDIDKFVECFESEKYKNQILLEQKEAEEYGITGTPASFINGRPIPGARPFEDYESSDNKERDGLKTIIQELIDDSNV